jgi:hypothetical protein
MTGDPGAHARAHGAFRHIGGLLLPKRDTRNPAARETTRRRRDGHLVARFLLRPSASTMVPLSKLLHVADEELALDGRRLAAGLVSRALPRNSFSRTRTRLMRSLGEVQPPERLAPLLSAVRSHA